MGLDPQTKDFLEQVNSKPVNYDTLKAEQARSTTQTLMLKRVTASKSSY